MRAWAGSAPSPTGRSRKEISVALRAKVLEPIVEWPTEAAWAAIDEDSVAAVEIHHREVPIRCPLYLAMVAGDLHRGQRKVALWVASDAEDRSLRPFREMERLSLLRATEDDKSWSQGGSCAWL